jgi:hypothetical protein
MEVADEMDADSRLSWFARWLSEGTPGKVAGFIDLTMMSSLV